jgi:hypothetical protein
MIKAAIAFLCFVAASAWFIHGLAWNWPWFLTMPFRKQYDAHSIYKHIRGRVFTKPWLAATLVGAAMFAAGWVSGGEASFVYLMLGAATLEAFVSGVITYRLFYRAIDELGLTYPPRSVDRS